MSSRRRFPVTAYDQINLTNLIDTLFFLLIIFMITAPLLEYSVDVTPPEMNADPIKPDTDSKIINVKADGSIVAPGPPGRDDGRCRRCRYRASGRR